MAVRVPAELTERDPRVVAPAAGLVFVGDDEPGITRRPCGRGVTYVDAFGATVDAERRAQIEALAIPPAWTDVWICPDERGYLQASGTDDDGRKQYRYHDEFRAYCEARKYERLRYFGRALKDVRAGTAAALDRPVGTRDHAIAAAVRLIDERLLRVGNHRSAENGHYGATTLTVEHVVDDGFVTLEYRAKSGQQREVVIEDDDLADLLVTLAADADDELFWFDDEESGERRRATAHDINRFVVEHAGPAFSAKDFRTWGGSAVALEERAAGGTVLDAVDAAAEELGNTRAVARSSYVHPAVTDADRDTIDRVWSRSRSSLVFDRSESALAKLLDDA